MDYIEYQFTIQPLQPYSDILMALLEPMQFETFIENEQGFLAYLAEDKPSHELENILKNEVFSASQIHYQTQRIPDKNWNEEWEKDFSPIEIDDQIYIKADFHPEKPFPYVIKIQPKMAFGTGHHETTYLMLEAMQSIDFQDKKVLDMGAGTAILAIFAKMKGAQSVVAIDIDEWAYENAIENSQINAADIEVIQGDVGAIQGQFDIVLANINKNILLQDIPSYIAHIKETGKLLLSGLLESDFDDINAVCLESGLIFANKTQKNEWISIEYISLN